VPRISVDLKKQVKAANDIYDVISTYIPVANAGKLLKAVCPFHNDTRPSLQIDRQYQNFRCWSCDAKGDVFDFVMKFEKVEFGECLRMLAEKAGIKLDTQASPQDEVRGRLLRAMKWAEEKYRTCLMDEADAANARVYLGERKLAGASVRQFGLGFAPVNGDWLVQWALREGLPTDVLVEIGLLGVRDENRGHYDRFRDRVMFPIRDVRGQTVGFGGRILPDSPLAARAPKYYNSSETPLFKKSELIYGLDLARHAGAAAGYLAVVEGYTDVMMAHQCGVTQVVATMGTALTTIHVGQLRRYVPKVVLVYDADAGGMGGVDRALELFVSQDVELAVASLPEGLDPCDLLVSPGGVEIFRLALANAQDALEFKLNILLSKENSQTVEGTTRVVDAILSMMALAPSMPSQAGAVRQELIVSRLAHRLGLRQETVWARLSELKAERRRNEQRPGRLLAESMVSETPAPTPKASAAMAIERQLLEVLLAEPPLVSIAAVSIPPEELQHSGLRRMLTDLYALEQDGHTPDLDGLRVRLMDRPDLAEAAMKLEFVGRQMNDRPEWLGRIVKRFAEQETEFAQKAVQTQLAAGSMDDAAALDLLRRLQASAKASPPNSN
jgi:DNA primase